MIRRPDETLLDEIRGAYAAYDPVPPSLVEAAKGALAWADPDAALAELTRDSLLEPAGDVRAEAEPAAGRILSFSADQVTIHLEVAGSDDAGAGGGGRILVGRLEPADEARVRVRGHNVEGGDVERTCSADRDGYFSIEAVPAGVISLEVRRPGAAPVVTSWIRV